jgi:hypothetical protein
MWMELEGITRVPWHHAEFVLLRASQEEAGLNYIAQFAE